MSDRISIESDPIETPKLPKVVEPDSNDERAPESVREWLIAHRDTVDGWLHRHAAVLLRGFRLATPDAFRAVAEACVPQLRGYVGGDSPRTSVGDRVYTSTDFPPHLTIGLHNELSYAGWWPERILFGCMKAPASGGETPLADARQVLSRLPARVRERFESKGVRYLQHLRDANGPPGPGKSWQQTFETDERHVVERICREHGAAVEWTPRGVRTVQVNPGVVAHPVTGERCWFNQADLWHVSFGMTKAQETAPTSDALGSHATFGDGAEIGIDELIAVRDAYRHEEVAFRWQPGDVLVVDNVLAMHGRKPYKGERRVLVAMG